MKIPGSIFRSVYARMFLVICAAAIPTFIGLCFYVYQQRMDFEKLAHDNAQRYVDLAARYQNWLIASSTETLKAIAATRMIQEQDWDACSRYSAEMLKQQDRYLNFGVIALDGSVKCSALAVQPHMNLKDRSYFIRALQSTDFVIGDYQLGRIIGKPTVVVAIALRDPGRHPPVVLFSSLNLASMTVSLGDMNLADGARFMVLDRYGTLLQASQSGKHVLPAGSRIALPRVAQMSLNSVADRGAGTLRAADGSQWLVSYVRCGPPRDRSALTVVYEQPMQTLPEAAGREFWIAVGIILLLMMLALGAGWFGTQAIVGRNLRYLTAAAQRLRQRDFKARIGNSVSGLEFVEIAHQFDQMAQELYEQEQITRRVMARQVGQYKILQLITAGRALPQTLIEVVLFSQRQIDGAVGSILLLDDDGKKISQCVAPDLPAVYCEAVIGMEIGPGVGTCGTAMYEKQLVITPNITTDPAWSAVQHIVGDLKVCWSYPIISSSGRVFGSFALYYREDREVGEEQLLLSQMAAELAAVAIERSRIENALTHSEAEYRLLFERNPYPMWVYDDRTLRILAANDPAIAHYGYSRAQFLLMTVEDLVPPQQQSNDALPDAGKHLRHRRRDGSVILVDIAVFPTSFGGSPAQLALVNDVTEREAMARNISERDQMLSLLMDSTAEAIYGVDLNGKCIFANNACVRLLGYSRATELLGHVIHDLVHYKHEDGRLYLTDECPIQSSLLSGINRHVDGEVLWRKDGTALPIEYWTYPIRRNGKISGAMVTFLDATERRRHNEALAYQARHDSLTGLYNRGVLLSAIDCAIGEYDRLQKTFGVMIIDLDGFKEVNDALGHQSGDLLLQQVAQRLRGALPSSSILTRLGGDEFALLTEKQQDVESVSGIARNIVEQLQQPFQLNGIQIQINASIGIACYPGDGASTMILMRNADAAMYRAKREGTGYVFYHQADTDQMPSRLLLMSQLRNALGEHQFALHYQPKTDMISGAVIGFEALVRWQHPERGLLYPDDFVPIVEISDLIHPLTVWVIETAVAQCKQWHALGNYVTMAVNVSMRNLLDVGLVDRVQQILERHALPASYLELELTESSIMADPARSLDVLTRLHELGVTVSIDDFGTGYSSLAYLQKLPVDSLKIDRSFVTEMAHSDDARAIVSAIIALAHTVGLKVTAEGIEDEATMQRLALLGCDVAQGYYVSRPMPAEAATRWLKRR
ncbi:MAG: diguanylate cyclase/phosphodiesterase [Herbaspirillum sp.]|nr:diguanylate cyclase/phosphodiesterase [Herbaspirillum sp.]